MNNNAGQKTNILNEARGRGLFYGVIAIATFIVMAVGATFAYFTATTESMNSAVQTGSTTLQLQYISYGSAWLKNDLIPADTMVVEYSVERQNDTTTTTPPTESEGEDGETKNVYSPNGNNTMCKDDYGNSICSIYVFQVKNSAQSPQTVSLNVVSKINGFASLNAMAYEVAIPIDSEKLAQYNLLEAGNGANDPVFRKSVEGGGPGIQDVTDGQGQLIYDFTEVYINRKGVEKTLLQYIESKNEAGPEVVVVKKPAIDRALVSLANEGDELKEATERTAKIADDIEIDGGETKTFALVLYIKNENYDQTETDAEKTFEGQVVVSSGDGSGGVSGFIGAITSDDFVNDLQSNTGN